MTTTFDEGSLRAALGRAAAECATSERHGDLASRVDHRIAAHERRAMRRRHGVAGALALFVIVVGVVAFTLRNDIADPPIVPAIPRGIPGWVPMPPSPLSPRFQHSQVWTGAELLVFGGSGRRPGQSQSEPQPGGAAYDPATGVWRPLPMPEQGLAGALTVWTGEDVLALASDGSLFAYRPSEDRWRERAHSPFEGASTISEVTTIGLWTGTELLVAGRATAAYDPRRDSWRDLPAPPYAITNAIDAAWTGSELLALASQAPGTPDARLVLASFDPDRETWRVVPDPAPTDLTFAGDMYSVWTGRELVVGGGQVLVGGVPTPQRRVAAYDPAAAAWRPLPEPPVAVTGLRRSRETWTGSEVLLWEQADNALTGSSGRPWLLDPATGTWRAGPASPVGARQEAPTTWTGRELLWWSGEPTAGDPSITYCCDPEPGGSVFTP